MSHHIAGSLPPARRTVLAGALAAAGTAALTAGPAAALSGLVDERNGGTTAPPTAKQRWSELQAKLSGITGQWTDQKYSGSISTKMPNTALLGNGDVGVTSGGSVGVKTFYISKSDFWNANGSTQPLPIGGITLKPTAGGGDNLAVGATATASSVDASFTPDRAVNGQWAPGYQGWVSKIGKPQWIALDLGSEQTIERYVIRNDDAARPGNQAFNTKDLAVQISADGSNWTDIDTITGNTAAVIDRNVAKFTTRYLRLYITEPTQNTTDDSIRNPRARIGQLELYALPKTAPNPGAPSPDDFHEVQRILDAHITTSVVMDGTALELDTWLAAEDNILVVTVTSQGPSPVELVAETWASANSASYPATAGVSGNTAWAQRSTASGTNWVSTAALATRVLGADSAQTPTVKGATASTVFTLQPGQTATIVTAVSGGGKNPSGVQTDAVRAADAQNRGRLTALAQHHAHWWKRYWLASSIDIGNPVLEKYYYAAQYFVGSASRPGKVAPGLYGVWITTDEASWHGDIHLNYNAQAPFYGVYSSNRPELALPFHDVILDYVPEAQRRAQQDLTRVKPDYVAQRFPSGGMPTGVLFPVGIGPFGSTTDDNYWQQVSNGLFAASQFCAYYDYTRDVGFLRDTAYPYLKLVAAFFGHWLEWSAGTKQYVHWSAPHEGSWGKNTTGDIGLLKQTLTTLIAASHVLDTDADARRDWQNIVDHLPAQPTSVYNHVTVYSLVEPGSMQGGDTRDIRPGDNTVNLEFIHPAEVLGITSPAAERKIAIDTVDVMNSWGQINSFPKVFTQAARVGYPAASLIKHLEQTIKQQLAANLRINDGAHGIEKSGATEAINSMLVQSFQGTMVLFPVWPADKDASFHGLLQPGAFEVSATLLNGTVAYAEITSRVGGSLRLNNPWADTRSPTVTDGGGHPVPFSLKDGIITVKTQADRSYLFRAALPTPTSGA
ncbi:discoidin domain-containing protein [Streptomyces sp. NBC_01221]|uniref:discoidin domain-containing protein n=1 Tax=Streptomyces sp. NBC_01221 TaxID=2903782 RepID=UPI002254E279|nr:discoidin domain-containing protein [Streptomyces sp. NBC_01221]MCX4791959.1 discoidin domain-containing protein [Streptomyces sp. NBC_01221]